MAKIQMEQIALQRTTVSLQKAMAKIQTEQDHQSIQKEKG
jgi:hypothetical protein